MSPDLRFALLGAVRAWVDGHPVDLGQPRQQTVLALLLLHANRPLSQEQLLGAVWGDTPPSRAVNLLQRHVSGLRRALEPDRGTGRESALVTWTSAGYVLALPPGTLDLDLVDRDIARARAARADGDVPAAAAALHRALDRWQGPLCEQLTSPALDDERRRWDERRTSVLEERIDLDLALGRHDELVGELRRLLAEHPLRERLHAQLVLALHRSGRTADALAAYQEARRHLRDELALEPGAALQALHSQVLAGDPDLLAAPAHPAGGGVVTARTGGPQPNAPVAPSAGPHPVVPAELPHGLADVVGREADLARLDALAEGLDAGGGAPGLIVAITGTAGVGKTTLAVQWSHRVRAHFPGGQLYVDLRGFDPSGAAVDPADAVRAFLDALGVPPQRLPVSLSGQAALYRSLVAGRGVLVLLDNARSSHQVRPLLPGSPDSLVVVTSRNQLPGLVAADGARPLKLDLLTPRASHELLERRIGRERVRAEPEEAARIVQRCAGLPLALAIVAARAALHPTFPLAALADELTDSRARLDVLYEGELTVDLRTVFSWSCRGLSLGAVEVFRLLGLHPGPDIGLAAAASLAGRPLAEVRVLLGELARSHLVEEPAPGRFALHDLLRAYAAELAEEQDVHEAGADAPGADRPSEAALARLVAHSVHSVHAARRWLDPRAEQPYDLVPLPPGARPEEPPDARSALRWCTAEHPGLMGVLRLATDHGTTPPARQLAWGLATFLESQGHWHDGLETAAAALAGARRDGDRHGEGLSLRLRARAQIRLGREGPAGEDLRQARDVYASLGDLTGQAHAHRELCWLLERAGRLEQALEEAAEALRLFRAAGHRVGEARALNALGWLLAHLGQPDEALTRCREALALQSASDDRPGQAETWDSLGYACAAVGRHDDSVAAYGEALALYRQLGDRWNEGDTLASLGDAHLAAGDLERARTAWLDAVTVLEDLPELEQPVVAQLREKVAGTRVLESTPA